MIIAKVTHFSAIKTILISEKINANIILSFDCFHIFKGFNFDKEYIAAQGIVTYTPFNL